MFKLIVLLATVAYASAGLYSGYGGLYGYGGYGYGSGYGSGYGLGHGVAAIAPYAPLATSYANTYKVAVAPAPITKVVAPAITKLAYAAPAITKVAYAPSYSAPAISYGGYGYSIPPSVTYLNNYGYGHGLGGLGYGGLGSLGYGYGLGYGHGYGYGGYYH
ncbi:cuticle protein 64 [Monomorium pharaonis]|uniref:cuticle protein 64 n=1 Tax=Monomorium pharaonis TaxID=307658 RepID=UPI00063FBEB0|nr:cuticle protein 64 [Monomorium pharaonis]